MSNDNDPAAATAREFVCVDCGANVTTFIAVGPNVPPNVCAVCAFLRTVPNVERRERLRELLNNVNQRDDTSS